MQADGSTYKHEYVIKDHLGNTRVTYRDDNTTASPLGTIKVEEIVQTNHFFPFGLNMEGNWNGSFPEAKNKYQFGGKELNSDFGLEWNDFGFRWYDPAIGRFPSVDPIIEKFSYLTPYNYASNSPVKNIDLWGLQGITPAEADKLGIIRDVSTSELRGFGGKQELSSWLVQKATFLILEVSGINGLDNTVADWDNPNKSVGVKIGETFLSANGLMFPGKPNAELKVGSYKELSKAGEVGDGITPHHMPSAKHMEDNHGVKNKDGIAINMEQGKHTETATYGNKSDVNMGSREALARGVKDARKIYQKHGLYGPEVRKSLQHLIELNKTSFPDIFKKPKP